MNRADDLRAAVEKAERSFAAAFEQYRLVLGCCASCGDLFELGMLAVVSVDPKGRVQFEHETCPEDSEDYRSVYRNPQQLDDSNESISLTESGINKLP